MDTSRYRQLLAEFSEQVTICDPQSGRLTNKWLQSFDRLLSLAPVRFLLMEHLSRVSRSVTAIQILAQERASLAPLVGAVEVLKDTSADLLYEMERLQKEGRRIDEVLADRGLEGLVGEFMSSVEFVMDYVQLRFNGSALTAFNGLLVHDAGQVFCETEAGYRDAICALIGVVVSAVEIREEDFIQITFSDSRKIIVPLRADDAVGPESAYLTTTSGRWWYW
jgi:hypothetical protein